MTLPVSTVQVFGDHHSWMVMENGIRRAVLRSVFMLHKKDVLGVISRQATAEPGCYLVRNPEKNPSAAVWRWQRSARIWRHEGDSWGLSLCPIPVPYEEPRLAQGDCRRTPGTRALCSLIHRQLPQLAQRDPGNRHCLICQRIPNAGPLRIPELLDHIATTMEN